MFNKKQGLFKLLLFNPDYPRINDSGNNCSRTKQQKLKAHKNANLFYFRGAFQFDLLGRKANNLYWLNIKFIQPMAGELARFPNNGLGNQSDQRINNINNGLLNDR